MNIIDFLHSHGVHYELSEGRIWIQCPFCKKENINGSPVASFSINQDTGRGDCGECCKSAEYEAWSDTYGIVGKEENKPRKGSSKKWNSKNIKTTQPEPIQAARVIKVEKPAREVSFETWIETIKANFPTLVFPAEVAASVIAQILITEITNPFALVLVDVPASGKTITLNFFDNIEGITYATDKFTPASFVSNASNVKKEDLPEIDLLPRIRNKTLLIRDLATIFSKNDDALNEALGLLTRVLDGEGLNSDSGTHGKRHYTGEYLFMMLAASTPIQPRVWKVMGNIGSRLFFIKMASPEKSEAELVDQITTLSPKKKEKICREATKDFLHTLWFANSEGIEWDTTKDSHEHKSIIARCAKLLAKLRGTVHVWEKKAEKNDNFGHQSAVMEYQPPVKENPDRINQLLYNVCRGHAVICGRRQLASEDLSLAIELATDSAPTGRTKLLRCLLDRNGTMRTLEVEKCLTCSKPTALREMETLRILGIATITAESDGEVGEPENEIKLSKDFAWFLTDECRAIRGLPPFLSAPGDIPE